MIIDPIRDWYAGDAFARLRELLSDPVAKRALELTKLRNAQRFVKSSYPTQNKLLEQCSNMDEIKGWDAAIEYLQSLTAIPHPPVPPTANQAMSDEYVKSLAKKAYDKDIS